MRRLGIRLLITTALIGAAAAQAPMPPVAPADLASLLEPEHSAQPSRPQTLLARTGKTTCCVVCKKGIPCGNSCISASKTCRKGPGCAC